MMKALSLRQPWAFAVVHLGKDIENRDWQERNPGRKFRGEFLIHASKSATREDREDYEELTWMCGHIRGLVTRKQCLAIPKFEDMQRGGIVGIGRITGLITSSDSPWFFGPIALTLEDVRPLPFTPCRGMLGFFDVDEHALGLAPAITGVAA
jgi:hypothetical protein